MNVILSTGFEISEGCIKLIRSYNIADMLQSEDCNQTMPFICQAGEMERVVLKIGIPNKILRWIIKNNS